MIEQPTQARYSIAQEGSILRLKIPSRKHWFLIFFIGLWSFLWGSITTGIFGMIISSIISAVQGPIESVLTLLIPGLFFAVWLVLWVSGGLFAIYLLLSQLIGQEIIEISPGTFSIVRRVLGVEKPKIYDVNQIKGLRVAPYLPQTGWPWGYNRQVWSRNTGTLAFDYGAKTIRFGDMDEAEAKMALADISKRYPNFESTGSNQKA